MYHEKFQKHVEVKRQVGECSKHRDITYVQFGKLTGQ